jgi:hypothetical protein
VEIEPPLLWLGRPLCTWKAPRVVEKFSDVVADVT